MSGTHGVAEGITSPHRRVACQNRLQVRTGHLRGQAGPTDQRLLLPAWRGLLEYVGPLVETHVQEKPLSIALREINQGLLTAEQAEPAEPE